MPNATQQRKRTTTRRDYARSGAEIYRNYTGTYGAAPARKYDEPMTYPWRRESRPQPKKQTEQVRQTGKVKKQRQIALWKIFFGVIIAAGLCFLLVYRYAAILERNDRIEKLNAEYTNALYNNQAIQAKIDAGLKLDVLEEYATEKLGMVRPDNSQIFYIDMQMHDSSQSNEGKSAEEEKVLQGTPGALVHAIRVLK